MSGSALVIPAVQVLDTTLRDGSYRVGYQFTSADTAAMVADLDHCGVPFIEIGHGLGIGAGVRFKPTPADSDHAYAAAAALGVRKAHWGMFAIPGIAALDDLDRMAALGMGFVRIGMDVGSEALAVPFIQRGLALGLWVSCNLMKTYLRSPAEVAELAKHLGECGGNLVCVVDSAGSMFPDDIDRYFEAIRSRTEVPLGFHGHDNLGLAVANTLRAVERGAAMVDVSLHGIGRSAGNAPAEVTVLALERRGVRTGIDRLALIDCAERRVNELMGGWRRDRGTDALLGYGALHSGALDAIKAAARRHNVDVRALLLRLGEEEVRMPSDETLDMVARSLRGEAPAFDRPAPVLPVPVNKPLDSKGALMAVAVEARATAGKQGLHTVFNLVQTYRPEAVTTVSHVLSVGHRFVIFSAEVKTAADAATLLEAIEGQVDLVLLDVDHKSRRSSAIAVAATCCRHTPVLTYSDLGVWARSIVAQARELSGDARLRVKVIGRNRLAAACRAGFAAFGMQRGGMQRGEGVAVVVCDSLRALPSEMTSTRFVIDGLIGGLGSDGAAALREAGVPLYRPDMRPFIHAEAGALADIREHTTTAGRGSGVIADVLVAAGGLLAQKGTVIVDSLDAPRRVLGLADGRGFIVSLDRLTGEDRARAEAVARALA